MTGGIYQKVAGVWTATTRPYVRISGNWSPIESGWRKTSGVWTQFCTFTPSPTAPPVLRLVSDGGGSSGGPSGAPGGNRITVNAKLPGASHDPNVKLIRILTTYAGAAPTTQFGGTNTTATADNWPQEPWSDHYYNSWTQDGYFPDGIPILEGGGPTGYLPVYSASNDSSVEYYKYWPRNASSSTSLPAGRYYFTGWSQSVAGVWSSATPTYIDLPSGGLAGFGGRQITTDQYFYPSSIGTYTPGGTTGSSGPGANGTFATGKQTQSGTGPKHGYAFYNSQIIDAVQVSHFSSPTTSITVNSAQVQVTRQADTGSASANLWMGLHTYTSATGVESTSLKNQGEFTFGVINAGTIAKGETKWIDIPADWIRSATFRGLKFWHQNPASTLVAADFSELNGLDSDVRAMSIHLNMTQNYDNFTG